MMGLHQMPISIIILCFENILEELKSCPWHLGMDAPSIPKCIWFFWQSQDIALSWTETFTFTGQKVWMQSEECVRRRVCIRIHCKPVKFQVIPVLLSVNPEMDLCDLFYKPVTTPKSNSNYIRNKHFREFTPLPVLNTAEQCPTKETSKSNVFMISPPVQYLSKMSRYKLYCHSILKLVRRIIMLFNILDRSVSRFWNYSHFNESLFWFRCIIQSHYITMS